MSTHDKYVVDTNVPITANCVPDTEVSAELVLACVEHIEQIVNNGGLVLDREGEIFNEYSDNLSAQGQLGVGNKFFIWIANNQWYENKVTRVEIHKNEDSYEEFPEHPDLKNFDISDRKFVAVSNAHPDKPAILEATDSKWWGWKDALKEVGIEVRFLCPEYVEKKFKEKMLK